MSLNIWETIILAILQGITELFPISSLGHTVIVPGLLPMFFGRGGANLVNDPNFLPLIVALHLGTSIALFIYFWRDWFQVIRSLFKAIKDGEVKRGTEEWVSFLIIIGCIPAGLIGGFLDKTLKLLFASPYIAAVFLLANGSLLFLGEQMLNYWVGRRGAMNAKDREAQFRPLSSMSWKDAIIVGIAQSLALIPGISRSGSSIVAGLGVRLNHEDAARFSFLLGAPLIGAAAALEVPSLFSLPGSSLMYVLLGVVLSGIAAFVSTVFLMRYFQTGRLYPFAWYCWAAGAIALVLLLAVIHYPL